MAAATLDIRPLTGTCGAEIHGLDLASPLSDPVISGIRQALARWGVVFFRDQSITPDQQKAFGRRFGQLVANPIYGHLEGHPEVMPVVKEADDKYNIGDTWHSDMSYIEQPPMGSILYARDLPPFGGDTLFASMTMAYRTLPDTLKKMVTGLTALHSDRYLTARTADRNTGRSTQLREDRIGRELSALHPVVRRHDDSGEPALYVNFPFTWSFDGMSREESLPLLNQLIAHATRPEFCCRFRWQKGSVAFWDNRGAMHYACNDYQGYRREMHRITVEGARPQAAADAGASR